MSNGEGFYGYLILILILVCFLIGHFCGASCENKRWEEQLVDNSQTVAAIKSKVLAERAVKAIK